MELFRIVAKIAIPNAPAILRTNASTEDAIPISCGSTTDATTEVRWAIPKPRPVAMTIRGKIKSIAVDLASIRVKRKMPIAATMVLQKIIYLG